MSFVESSFSYMLNYWSTDNIMLAKNLKRNYTYYGREKYFLKSDNLSNLHGNYEKKWEKL